jgi:hypothetical protein
MPGAEIPFEQMDMVMETVRGTAVTPPDHRFNAVGTLVPKQTLYFPPDQIGVLAEYQRSEVVRRWAEWSMEGDLDVTKLAFLLNLVLAPVSTAGTGGGRVTGYTGLVGGSGYTTGANVAIAAPPAGGRQATATATVAGGVVTAIVTTDEGRGYTSPPVATITPVGAGSGASVTVTVSAIGVLSKYWEFIRSMTVDNLKTATAYWGDPNVVIFQGAYATCDTFSIKNEATKEGAASFKMDGHSRFPTDLTGGGIPALPSIAVGPVLINQAMELFIDNITAAWGTTLISGRVAGIELKVTTGITYKYTATGPAGGVTFDHIGRKKTHPELSVEVEVADQVQYLIFKNATLQKVRVHINGPLIEGVLYNMVEIDIVGKLDLQDVGDVEGTNRTYKFMVSGEYNSGLASDLRVGVQTVQTTL